MSKYYTVPLLKQIAESIRIDLSAQGVSLKLTLSRHLVSHVLVKKDWTRLSPALPKEILYPDDAAERMAQWLYKRHKPLDKSVCETILNKYFDIKDNEHGTDVDLSFLENSPNISPDHDWTFIGILADFKKLRKQKEPLHQRKDKFGLTPNSIILLNPEEQTISAQKFNENGNMAEVHGREYIFNVPSTIPGIELIELVESEAFVDILQSISHEWELDWDGRNHRGIINDKTHKKLIDFRNSISGNMELNY